MSVFEKYHETSRHYDVTRVPVGSEIILGCLARHGRPLAEMTVLDAGCGTGAYAQTIIDRVGRIEALDLNDGMLKRARKKLARAVEAGRIGFHQGSITDPPFDAGSFDAVMINQVVHHLGGSPEDGFPALRHVVGEFARVLRSGGVLVINHCSQEQLRHGYWYHALIPKAHRAFLPRCVPLGTLGTILEAAGFVNHGRFVPVDAVFQGEAYFDGRGPLSQSWRDGDSIWALVGEAELAEVQARIRALDAAGRIEAFVAECDARRPSIGQTTFLCARRT